jgi:hypothetical protein
MIAYIPDPKFKPLAALYFLDSGDYLFKEYDGKQGMTKFVTSADVAAAFAHHEIDLGWLPAGVARCGYNAQGAWYVYSAPMQKVQVILGDESLIVPIPRTVMLGIGRTYYLLAQKGWYFYPQGEAFHAPFPNVHPNGKVCWGQNTPPEAKPEEARRVWELFFKTPFNGDLAAHKSMRNQQDVRITLREASTGKHYPGGDLISMKEKTDCLIERALR